MSYNMTKVTFIFICFAIFSQIQCDDDGSNSAEIKMYNELREQCLHKLNISSLLDVHAITNLACMDRCILEKVGIITAEGVFNVDNIPENIRHVALVCNEETQHLDACQRAQSYNLCVFTTVGIKVLAEVCANETGIALDYDNMPKTMMNLTDESLGCYNRCMLIKMEKIDVNNHINSNLLKIYVNDAVKVSESVRICEEINQQENECDQAVQRELCIVEKLT